MRRERFLVAYDIADPKRLRRVHRVMKGFGMPMQYSVFVCQLTAVERYDLMRSLSDVADYSVDCVAIVALGDIHDESVFEFFGPVRPMPHIGPTVV